MMGEDKEGLPQRRPNRLREYDYSRNGAYFLTLCTHNKAKTLYRICRDDPCGHPHIEYTPLGEIALRQLEQLKGSDCVSFDKYIVMPNHVHVIVTIDSNEADSRKGCPYTIPQIIGAYKSIVANEYLRICKRNNVVMGKIWQRSYHDHIIRDYEDYLTIWHYIDTNPIKWEEDCFYTA